MQYYQLHLGDWLKETAHLTPEEEGIFLRCIAYYMDIEGPLKDDLPALKRRLRLSPKNNILAKILGEFFILKDGFWVSENLDLFISKIGQISDVRKNSAIEGWSNRRKNPYKSKTEGMHLHSLSYATQEPKEPITLNHSEIVQIHPSKKPSFGVNQTTEVLDEKEVPQTPKSLARKNQSIECPTGVVWKTYSDFLKVRKAVFTETALNLMKDEAIKAGVSIEMAFQIATERGWKTFRADWNTNPYAKEKTAQKPDFGGAI